MKSYNREFIAIAKELQPLRSIAVWHTDLKEQGCEAPPAGAPFRLDTGGQPATKRGFLIGCFGAKNTPTHLLVVNLDYNTGVTTALTGPGRLKSFDAPAGHWNEEAKTKVELRLPPGGGHLLRVEP